MNFLKRFPQSVYNFKAYNKLRKTSMISTIMYLLILALLLSGFIAVRPMNAAYRYQNMINNVLDDNINELNIKDSKLIVNNGEEFSKIETDGKVFFGIDTGENVTADNYVGQMGLILSKEGIVGRVDSPATKLNEPFSVNYDSLDITKNISDNTLLKGLNSIAAAIRVNFLILSPIVIFIEYLVLSLIFAIIAAIICNGKQIKLNFGERYRVAVYASTVIFALRAIFSLIGITIPFLILVIIQVVYMNLAIKAIKIEEDIVPMS